MPSDPSPVFHADLHIHSKYSRACSRDCDLEHLTRLARRKGLTLVGTGDFTHPAWNAHLHEALVPAEPGLYRLRDDLSTEIDRTLPPIVAGAPVRFMLSVEISTIYKRDDRTRKVHHLVYLPDLDAVDRFNTALGRIGNLASDGRPILGLDSRDLLEITLEASPDGYLVPAHIWTPWFAALGSKSGFDAIADCYADLADHVFAVETGLSSDPEMNWRVSSLDKYTLVSNSDAHSPPALAREAHSYTCDLDYFAVRDALRTGDGYAGSFEFFPEEGKYHADGHRSCDVRWDPEQTRAHGGRCGSCGKPVTVGVLSRIEELADRAAGDRPARHHPFTSLVQLPEIVGEIAGVGPRSKTVTREVDGLVAALGPELDILTTIPVDHVTAVGGELLGEAISRLRRGEVTRESGYDGEYGVITLFAPGEVARRSRSDEALFDLPAFDLPPTPAPRRPPTNAQLDGSTVAGAEPRTVDPDRAPADQPVALLEDQPLPLELPDRGVLEGLDPEQRAAAGAPNGPVLVVAGPGTGKTRTLTHRVAHLVAERDVDPGSVLAITFTRRAAGELAERLDALLPGRAEAVTVATFHALALKLCREQATALEIRDEHGALGVADETDRRAVLAELTDEPPAAGRAAVTVPAELREGFLKALHARGLLELDELVPTAVRLLAAGPTADRYRQRWEHVLVDEYQDVDADQYALLRLLVPPGGNLYAIGDPDQAIYSFRGADVGFFLRFAEDYPGAVTTTLSRNYRSAPPIVAAATQAIRSSSLVPGRRLDAERRDLGAARIALRQAATTADEAAGVARQIDVLVGGSSFHSLDTGRVDGRGDDTAAVDGEPFEPDPDVPTGFGDIAVLYRTDAQARAIIEAFTRAGLPYQKRGHDRLADRPGVAALLRELRLAGAARQSSLVARVRAAAATLEQRAATPDLFTGDFTGDFPGYQAADLAGDQDPRGVAAWSAAELLMPLAAEFGDDLPGFLTAVATGAEVDALDPRADAVGLLTLHAAKGLEFPVVFLVGCVDGLLPLRWPGQRRPAEDDSGPAAEWQAHEDEERRLFFVGLTRAQRRLYLSASRTGRGVTAGSEAPLTPFLAGVDEGLLTRTGATAGPARPRTRQLRLI